MVDGLRRCSELAQIGALELHVWGSRAAHLEQPDIIVFDLDPSAELRVAGSRSPPRARPAPASSARAALHWRLTGGKGLHVVVPVVPEPRWPAVKKFARALVDEIVRDEPSRFTASISKSTPRAARSSSTTCATTAARPRSPAYRRAHGLERRWRCRSPGGSFDAARRARRATGFSTCRRLLRRRKPIRGPSSRARAARSSSFQRAARIASTSSSFDIWAPVQTLELLRLLVELLSCSLRAGNRRKSGKPCRGTLERRDGRCAGAAAARAAFAGRGLRRDVPSARS